MGVAATEDELDTEQHEDTENTEGQSQDEGLEGDQGAEGSEGAEGNDGEDEDVVQIGEEEPPASEEEQPAPKWVKGLRERQRQLTRENAELKARLNTGQPGAQQMPKLPPEPMMADPDIDFDEEKFKAAMHGWYAKKKDFESFEARQQEVVKQRQKAVQAVHENYATSKKALKVKDFQDAEEEVMAVFDQVQQSIVIAGATNPGAMVYALGKTPKKLAELASIKDPVKFAVAVGKLETEVKVTKRTSTKPAPETTVRGNSSTPSSTATLERLQAEADKTGDRTKVAAYLRRQRQAGK